MSLRDLNENKYITLPEADYQAEELQKKLKYSMANFAQVRFKHYMKMRLTVVQNV